MKTRSTLLGILFLVATVAGACSGPSEVVIGGLLALDGAAAPYGNSIQRGIEIAVDEVNAAGGVDVGQSGTRVPLRIEMRDTRSDPTVGLQMGRELIDMGLPAVIGAVSSDVTLAVADLFQQSGVILLSPSTSTPALSDKGSYIYRNYPSDELEAVNMANHIYNVAGIHDIDFLGSQSEYGLGIQRAFIERFRALGGSVINLETFPPDATDMSQQAADLVGSEAGAVYIAGYSAETAAAARALRDAGIEVPLFGDGAVLPGELVAAGGDAVEGLVYPTAAFDPEGDEETVRRFVQAYGEKFGAGVDVYAAHGYDAVMILVQAIEQEGYRADNISFYLNAMNPFPGAAGSTTFDDDGNARKFHRMFVIRNGRSEPIS